jgi:hypothetical protein
MSDAAFNKTTDISLNAILEQTNKTRLFMSATGDYMKKYLNNYKKLTTIDYDLDIDYSFVKKLTFYNRDTTLDIFMEEALKSQEKAIFFIENAGKAYEFYNKYKEHCLFNCSKSNKKYYKYVDKEKIKEMLINEKFNDLILITTTAMDAGVNIKDNQLKHIVCDVEDIGTIIQCIGRKRLSTNDNSLYLYVKSLSNQQLGGIQTQINKKLEMARFLKNNTVKEFIEKYQRKYDSNQIVYDDAVEDDDKGTKKINWLMYFRCLTKASETDIMIQHGKFGYNKTLARKLGFYNNEKGYDYRLIEEEIKSDELEKYLDSLIDNKLNKQDQKELITKIDLKVNGRTQRSYSKLNEGLKMIHLPYIIIPKKSGNERYWIVEKIDD